MLFREEATSALAVFQAGPLPWLDWNLEMFIRRKTLRARQEPQTNSTHTWHRAGIKPRPHW